MAKSNLMSHNTFTFKTEAQMLFHIRLWEDKGYLLFENSLTVEDFPDDMEPVTQIFII